MKAKFLFILIIAILMAVIPIVGLKPLGVAGNSGYKVLDKATNQVVNLSLDDYLFGCVAAQIPVSFHIESLKTQAIIAHTYAEGSKQTNISKKDATLKGADFALDLVSGGGFIKNDELKKQWGTNYDTNCNKIKSACNSVKKYLIKYNKKPIIAAYHKISSGKTESAKNIWGEEVAYLVPVDSVGDPLSPQFEEKLNFSKDEVKQKLISLKPDLVISENPAEWFLEPTLSESGTVLTIKAAGNPFTGIKIRDTFGLKSAVFTVVFESDTFKFTTKGFGHGVGLSQYGADYLARQGKTFKQILLHYYTGVEII